jgi:hypothetical protein
VRWRDLLGAGRVQMLIRLRGLNLSLQAVVSSGIDIRALLIIGSRTQQIWEDSEHDGRNSPALPVLLSRLHLSRRHFAPPAQTTSGNASGRSEVSPCSCRGGGGRCVDLT